MLLLKLNMYAMILCLLKLLLARNLKNSILFPRNYFVKGEILFKTHSSERKVCFEFLYNFKKFYRFGKSFWISLQLHAKSFSVLERTYLEIITKVLRFFISSVSTVCLTFTKLKFSPLIFMKVAIEIFTQIFSLEAEMIHEKEMTERRTDVQTNMKNLTGCAKYMKRRP